jgi:hypothetical protein
MPTVQIYKRKLQDALPALRIVTMLRNFMRLFSPMDRPVGWRESTRKEEPALALCGLVEEENQATRR